MAKALVVVESPAKAKTINKYLGRNYKVIASMGHVRDLPKSKLGVDIGDDFEPSYEVIASRKKVLKELKDAAKESEDIYIATDSDREREIDAFVAEEYWNITARLAAGVPPEFDAKLQKRDGAAIKVGNQAEAEAVLADLKQADWVVASVTTKERKKNAVPPFITS